MNIKNKIARFACMPILMAFMVVMGCGGSDSPESPTKPSDSTGKAELTVLPADFDFGIVTDGNQVAPLEVTIRNDGTEDLIVSDIALSDTVNFSLDENDGASPCAVINPTLAPGDECTVTVAFGPQSTAVFTAAMTITSNDPTSPQYDMGLAGTFETVDNITVKVNQIIACPREDARVFVSVTDQGGFTLSGLEADNFTLLENGAASPIKTSSFLSENPGDEPLSIALLMDYSGSIFIDGKKYRTDMENAATAFVESLETGDEAEIIKFGTTVRVMQQFTTDPTLLVDAITTFPQDLGFGTALYDAIDLALDRIITRASNDRKAIVVMTDGKDDDGTRQPLSEATIEEVIGKAQSIGVPIFTVSVASADVDSLGQLADETGGTLFASATSSNLATVYQQLAALLLTNQYVLTYDSGLAVSETGELEVAVDHDDMQNSDTRPILACP